MKDVLKSVSTRHGVPSVMDPGQPMMPMSPVDNWDMQPLVTISFYSYSVFITTLCFMHKCRCKSFYECLLWSWHRAHIPR